METTDIVRVLSKDAYTRWLVCDVFDGVHAAYQLHSPLKRPTAMVVNTEPSWKQGRHWVAIYLPNTGSLEYFDSFGEPPKVSFIRRFLKNKPFVYNHKPLQSLTSDVCGHYCIYYLVHRARGMDMDGITARFDKDRERNDEDVFAFVHQHYG